MIVAAAIRFGSLICSLPAPARHHDILRAVNRLYVDGRRDSHTYEIEQQGFVTDAGAFLGRRHAMKHALECGQGTPRRGETLAANPKAYNGADLFSEDLW